LFQSNNWTIVGNAMIPSIVGNCIGNNFVMDPMFKGPLSIGMVKA